MSQITRYFAGGNTADGFVSFFPFVLPENVRKRMYYVKGGPGVGKSSFMKVIGSELEEIGYGVEYFYCSGDPESLDAVTIPELGVGIMDATAPHSYDPMIPGARDTLVSLGDYLDEEAMSPYASDLVSINENIGMHYSNCYHYLKAAAELKTISYHAKNHVIMFKEKNEAMKYADQMVQKYLADDMAVSKQPEQSSFGTLRKLFGEAYTHMGYISYVDALPRDRTVLVTEPQEDRLDFLFQELLKIMIAQGINVTALYNPLNPQLLSHLYLPEKKMLFTGEMSFNETAEICEFYHTENSTQEHKPEDEFYGHLIKQAVNQLKSAKKAHDELESYYVKSMNFEGVAQKLNDVLIDIIRLKQ